MRVGSIVFATTQGLGILAKAFYDHDVITDVLVQRHSSRPNLDWYPGAKVASLKTAMEFAKTVDVMLFFETPFFWDLLPYCRENGVRTVLMPMYECYPTNPPYEPDAFICPSLLDMQYFPNRSTFIPVPVEVEWRQRTRAEVFVHNAGHGGLQGRNGTRELIDAMQYVKSPIKLILRSQEKIQWQVDSRVDLRIGTVPHEELWRDGDVFVFPEKFNGLSLPLQEAHAAGMLVMGTNRFPMNTWLPQEPLICPSKFVRNRVARSCLEFDEAVVDPKEIARTIDDWYRRDISEYSLRGKSWAEENSWAKLKPRYMEVLSENLLHRQT